MEESSRRDTPTRASIVSEIHRRFVRFTQAGMPKYMQLRRAIQAGIEDGDLKAGDQIPPEGHLTTALGISLGTVRRALEDLAFGGFLTREHGRGTFIAEHRHELEGVWHYRFVAEDGRTFLPVFSRVVDRNVIQEHGPWADALGKDHNRYVRIKRHVNVGNKFLAYSEFYLDHDRFGRILELPESRWDNVNFKAVLNTEFNAPTVYVQQRLRVQRFPEEIATLLSVGRRTNGLFQEIVAFTYDNSPISYQMIYTPPTSHMLDLSAPGSTVRMIANTE